MSITCCIRPTYLKKLTKKERKLVKDHYEVYRDCDGEYFYNCDDMDCCIQCDDMDCDGGTICIMEKNRKDS